MGLEEFLAELKDLEVNTMYQNEKKYQDSFFEFEKIVFDILVSYFIRPILI